MAIDYLEVDLSFPEAQSLKDKRRILVSLKTKLRQTFNVSAAETGELDLCNPADSASSPFPTSNNTSTRYSRRLPASSNASTAP